MRRPVVLAGFAVLAAAIGIARGLAAPQPPAAGADTGEGARLVGLLKTVADKGLLYDPRAMADVLRLGIHLKEERKVLGGTCNGGRAAPPTIVTSAKFDNAWYRPGPEGIQNMKFPEFFINPAGQAGEPSIDYSTYRFSRCDDGDYERIEARLTFGNLSGFSCLTPARLEALIGAKHYMATDGVSLSSYAPPATDRYGARLEFLFRAGAPCALAATVQQDTRDGKREQRAFSNWRWCVARAEQEFCRTHRDLKPGEDGQIRSAALEACGSEEAFLQKEPLSGPPAGPLPQVKLRGSSGLPCRD